MAENLTHRDRNALLIATCVAAITTPLMSTMMNLSLLDIGSDFNVGSHAQAYVNTMFLLGSVVSMVPSAKYASVYGMKKVFNFGLFLLMIFCVLSFLSPSFYFLVAMRFFIGFATAMMAVTSMAMLTYSFPLSVRGKVLGFNTTFVYLGLSLGPTIGGFITDFFGWRYVFVFILCLSFVSLFTILCYKCEIVPTPDCRMDWFGTFLWGIMIICTMFGFVNLTESWGLPLTGIGIVLLICNWKYLRDAKDPVLNTKMFRNPVFTRSCVAAFMNYGASYCITFFLSLYLQSIGQLTATEAGALLLIQPFMQVLLSTKMGSISDRITDKRIMPFTGMVITLIGVSMYLFISTEFSMVYVVAIMIVTGLGLGIFCAPNNNLIMSSAPPEMKGEASGVLAVVRQTGMMISMGVAMASLSVIMGSTDNLGPETYGLFVDALHLTFGICVAMCTIGAICSAIKVHTELN